MRADRPPATVAAMGDRIAFAVHVIGFTLWLAGLFAAARLLSAREAAGTDDTRSTLATLARRQGILADIGSTLALLAGLHLVFKLKLLSQPWMLAKLGLVVCVLILHTFVRIKTRHAARGERGFPSYVVPVLLVLAAGVIGLAAIKPGV